jgi:hypothetical protein
MYIFEIREEIIEEIREEVLYIIDENMDDIIDLFLYDRLYISITYRKNIFLSI